MAKVKTKTKLAIALYVAEYWDPSTNLGLSKSYIERRKDAALLSAKYGTPEATIFMSMNFMTNYSTELLGRECPSTCMVAHGSKGPKWCQELAEVLVSDGALV